MCSPSESITQNKAGEVKKNIYTFDPNNQRQTSSILEFYIKTYNVQPK